MNIDMVKDAWDRVTKCHTIPDEEKFPKYKDGFIFDEEKSVRWNKEEVIRRNNLYLEESKRLKSIYNMRINKAVFASVRYIMQETSLSEPQAKLLWHKVYDEHHAYMSDVFNYLEEEIDFINEIREEDNIPTNNINISYQEEYNKGYKEGYDKAIKDAIKVARKTDYTGLTLEDVKKVTDIVEDGLKDLIDDEYKQDLEEYDLD